MNKLTLVDNAKNAWRWFSVQSMVLAVAIQGSWMFLSDEQKATLPTNFVQYLTLVLLALGLIGRLVKQEKVA